MAQGLHLLTAASNGNGASKQMVDHSQGNISKRFSYSIYVYGTFGGATVTLEGSHDDSTWIAITNASWTAKATTNIEFYGNFLRGVVTGGTGESINMVLV